MSVKIILVVLLAASASSIRLDLNIPAFDQPTKDVEVVTEISIIPEVAHSALLQVENTAESFLNRTVTLIKNILDQPTIKAIINSKKTVYDRVQDINVALNAQALVNDNTHLKVNFDNLKSALENKILALLRSNLKNNFLVLSVAEKFVTDILDNYNGTLKTLIGKIDIPLKPIEDTRQLIASAENDENPIRNVITQVVQRVLKPIETGINSTLNNVTSNLLNFYQPQLPSTFLEKITTYITNQSILKAVDLIDAVRNGLEDFFANGVKTRTKRSLESVENQPNRSFIDVLFGAIRGIINAILTPIRILINIILTPIRVIIRALLNTIHNLLRDFANYSFLTIRPIVGKVILGSLENFIYYLIDLIPCSNCL